MSFFINPGNTSFSTAASRDFFVDKSEMIIILNDLFGSDQRGRICVSRPRRFGKTMATNMLKAYYSSDCDSRELFSKLKLSQHPGWDKWLNKCNVLSLDICDFFDDSGDNEGALDNLKRRVVREMVKKFPDAGLAPDTDIYEAISMVYESDGRPFVVIMDEYDAPLRFSVSEKVLREYLNFLRKMFKTGLLSEVVQLAYITGIIPIIREKCESKLNNFTEYTMLRPKNLAQYFGFTKDEVKMVCDESGIDFGKCVEWYDGYKLNGDVDIFSPYSVTEAAKSKLFEGHWTHTAAYDSLIDCINMDIDGIQADVINLVEGGSVGVDVEEYKNTLDFYSKNDILTYLVHLGYLAYNPVDKTVSVPNLEVREEWVRTLKRSREYTFLLDFARGSRNLLDATIRKDAKAVADALDYAHQEATTTFSYNNELSLQTAIKLAYFCAQADYNIFTELPAGRGYADMAFIPKIPSPSRPAIIVELKWNRSTQVALDQIRTRRYADALRGYKGGIILAAITYNPDDNKHECEFEAEEV